MIVCAFQSKMVTLQVQEYDSEPFSDMSPLEEGNVCHDPGGRCDDEGDDDLVQSELAILSTNSISISPLSYTQYSFKGHLIRGVVQS